MLVPPRGFEILFTDDWITIKLNDKVIWDNHTIDPEILYFIATELKVGLVRREIEDSYKFLKAREKFIKEG